MERGAKLFSYNDVQRLDAAMAEHSTMVQQVGEMKSFPLELAMIASVLRENHMPQEMINMTIAARCGLPVEGIDLKSLYFDWVDEPEAAEAATEAVPENETAEERFQRLRAKALSVVEGAGWEEGLNVLASALNEFAAPYGHGVKSTLHPLVCSEG